MNKTTKIVSTCFLVLGFSAGLLIARTALMGNAANYGNRTEITFFGWGNESEVALTEQFV